MKMIFGSRRHCYAIKLASFLIVVALIAGMAGCEPSPSKSIKIQTWYDLNDVRNNLAGSHILMNDLDSNTAGYTQLASPTANGGKGWQPINGFTGTFNGQGYTIRDLCINRPHESNVGLFGYVGVGGVIKNVGILDANVTGGYGVGGLVGYNFNGIVSNSYSTGTVTGGNRTGGLVGDNGGIVSDSYSTSNVTGSSHLVGGLIAYNYKGGTVINSYSTGSVTGGDELVGGLAGENAGITLNCSSSGNVAGHANVGGLVGLNNGNVSDSYSTGSVTGNSSVGGLIGYNFKTFSVSNSYSTGSVTGGNLTGGLVGFNHGNVSDCYSTGSVTGYELVGGLVGLNYYGSSVSDSYSTGNVTGNSSVGGLVGLNDLSTVSNSYYNFNDVLINGENIISIGALLDADFDQWLTNNKFIDVNERLTQAGGYYIINNVSDFKELLVFGQNDTLKFRLTDDLNLSAEPNFFIPYLAGEFDGNGHNISNLSFSFGFVSVVGLFGCVGPHGKVTQVGAENVNIVGGQNVGGLVGTAVYFGNVSNSYSTGSVTGVNRVTSFPVFGGAGGLVGNMYYGTVSNSSSTTNVTCDNLVGGLIAYNYNGTVTNSYSTGSVSGNISRVGGLVGWNMGGSVSDCYSTGSVTGMTAVGGLVGLNEHGGSVSNSYSTGSVTGNYSVGGLVGANDYGGTVSDSFWDTVTSGQSTSAGGTGKTTTDMQKIITFSGAGWDIIGVVNPSTRNPAYIWNIVNNVTYPFLSWQPV